MLIGVLTSGGDCPGLKAVIRSVVHRAVVDHGDEVIGFHDGWKGLLECDYRKLDLAARRGVLARGGPIMGWSRMRPAHLLGSVEGPTRMRLPQAGPGPGERYPGPRRHH